MHTQYFTIEILAQKVCIWQNMQDVLFFGSLTAWDLLMETTLSMDWLEETPLWTCVLRSWEALSVEHIHIPFSNNTRWGKYESVQMFSFPFWFFKTGFLM